MSKKEKAMSRLKKWQMSILIGTVIISALLVLFWSEFIIQVDRVLLRAFGYEEVASVNDISLLFKNNTEHEALVQKILECSRNLEKLLGPPLYKGRIAVDPHALIPGQAGQLKTHFIMKNVRLLQFPVETAQDIVYYHELVHCFYQTDKWINNYPLIAVEGLAEAIASDACKQSPSFLIPRYNDYYLKNLTGLIKPDSKISDELVLKNVTFSITALFFQKLQQIEPGIYTRLLNYEFQENTSWSQFLQCVIDQSPIRKEVLIFINQCSVFSILKSHFYAIPVCSASGGMYSVILYVDYLSGVDKRTLQVKIARGKNDLIGNQLVTFHHGVGQIYLENKRSIKMAFHIHMDGSYLETILN